MAENLVEQERSCGKSSSGDLSDVVSDMLKESFNRDVEVPVNMLIKAFNYGTGYKLPELNLSGLNDCPKGPITYYKA